MVLIQKINVFDTKTSIEKGVTCMYLVTHSVSEHIPPSVNAFLTMDDVNDYVRKVEDVQKQAESDVEPATENPLRR